MRTGLLKKRVLIADDNAISLSVCSEMLEALGHQAEIARSGKDAVRAFSRGSFDLVLMDFHMPDINGCLAASMIRRLERRKGGHTPIVAFTGDLGDDSVATCIRSGMNGVLEKPLSMRKLALAVERWTREGNAPSPEDVDAAAIRNLQILDDRGAKGFTAELVARFIASAGGRIDRIRAAIEREDAKALVHESHAMKSSSAFVGARAIAVTCQTIEKLGGDTAFKEDCIKLSDRLREELERYSAQVRLIVE